jgi:hypothetical protein
MNETQASREIWRRAMRVKAVLAQSGHALRRSIGIWLAASALGFGLAGGAVADPREDDPAREWPGRAGRVAEVQGGVWWYDVAEDRWLQAQPNRVLDAGDRLTTDAQSKAQLDVGSTQIRLADQTALAFGRLDDGLVELRIQRGTVAVRVRNPEMADEVSVSAGRMLVSPRSAGHLRVDRGDGRTRITAWQGVWQVDTGDQRFELSAGRSVEITMLGRDASAVSWSGVDEDAFADAVQQDIAQERHHAHAWPDQPGESPLMSTETTGMDDLARHGRWERHPQWGWVWFPVRVAVDWVPYRQGRWVLHARWGWTWQDDAPWGFATSHYGRWASWGNRWVWLPGAYVRRPVFAPALVGWTHAAPGVSLTVQIGSGPSVGWWPLAPWDTYVPPFHASPRYRDRVNEPIRRARIPEPVRKGPISYGAHGVPVGVTTVSSDVLKRQMPVAPVRQPQPEPGRRQPRVPVAESVPAATPNRPPVAVPAPISAPVIAPMPGSGSASTPGRRGGDRQSREPDAVLDTARPSERAERGDRVERVDRVERDVEPVRGRAGWRVEPGVGSAQPSAERPAMAPAPLVRAPAAAPATERPTVAAPAMRVPTAETPRAAPPAPARRAEREDDAGRDHKKGDAASRFDRRSRESVN